MDKVGHNGSWEAFFLDSSFQACILEFCVVMFLKDQQIVAKAIGEVFVRVGIAIKKVSSCKHEKTGTSTYMGMAVSYNFLCNCQIGPIMAHYSIKIHIFLLHLENNLKKKRRVCLLWLVLK